MGLRSPASARGKGLELNLAGWEDTVRSAEIIKTPFTAAIPLPKLTRFLDSLLVSSRRHQSRYWCQVDSGTSSPSANMRRGRWMPSVPATWPYRIVRTRLASCRIDGGNVEKSPEEYFAMRADWVDKIPRLPKRFWKASWKRSSGAIILTIVRN